MLKAIQMLQEAQVKIDNNLRFNHSETFNLILKSDEITKSKKVLFIGLIFEYNFVVCTEIVERCSNGESFLDVTNDLNVRKSI